MDEPRRLLACKRGRRRRVWVCLGVSGAKVSAGAKAWPTKGESCRA